MPAFNIYLMRKVSTVYEKLVDIKNHGDIHGEPESIERTTKTDTQRRYIEGLVSNETKTFACNYEKTDYDALKLLEGTVGDYAIFFGDVYGSDGRFGFSGNLRVRVLSSDVGTIPDMEVKIVPTTGVTDLDDTVLVNDDTRLETLSVLNGETPVTLSPTLDDSILVYDIGNITQPATLTVSATANDVGATVTLPGSGSWSISADGYCAYEITVTNGVETRVYRIIANGVTA